MPDRDSLDRPADPTTALWATLRRALVLGALFSGMAWLIALENDPDPGENLALRWIRTAAQHPLRTAIAAALVAGSALPRRLSDPSNLEE